MMLQINRLSEIILELPIVGKPDKQGKFSRIVDYAELKKNDYNVSPSRYIHTGDAETYRPLAEIVADLDAVEAEAREADAALREILRKIGV